MKIERVIQLAGMVERGNVLPEELAIEFLSEFDGMIQSDIMLHAPEEIVRYDSKDQELLLRPPHDGLYLSFLVAMIRQCQGEFEGYNNAQEIVEDKLKTFRRWYIHHYRPADTNSRSYTGGTSGDGFGFAYLSAYGLAVKHGYQGTEEEWLQSLKGEKGDAGAAARMRYDAERDMVQWGVGEEWHDLYTMAQVLAPLYEKLDEMTARAETAAGAAAGHAQAAQTAREQVENVLHDAEGHAREALEQANKARAAAEEAERAGAAADAARAETAGLRDETRILMQDAETAAQTARDEAERAAEAAAAGGVRTGEDAPSSATEGRVGSLYLQTGITPNCLWVCIGADDGVYRWQQCNVYTELDLRDGGDGGVLLVPEGTETQPVLNLYGRYSDENVTLRGVAPAQRDTDAPNLRQVQELIGQGDSGGSSGPAYVAAEEPPEDTGALWVDTSEQGEAVALGVTAVETAEGVDLYCTDELGTKKVSLRNGKDGAPGDTPVKGKDYFDGEPGDDGITPHIGDNGNWFIGDTDTGKPSRGASGADYELTDPDKEEIAGIAAEMVENVEAVTLLDTSVEIPAETPVTELEWELPEDAKRYNAFYIEMRASKPANSPTSDIRVCLSVCGNDLSSSYCDNGLLRKASQTWVTATAELDRRCVLNAIFNNSPVYNISTSMNVFYYADALPLTERNNLFLARLRGEYAGTVEVKIVGYSRKRGDSDA